MSFQCGDCGKIFKVSKIIQKRLENDIPQIIFCTKCNSPNVFNLGR